MAPLLAAYFMNAGLHSSNESVDGSNMVTVTNQVMVHGSLLTVRTMLVATSDTRASSVLSDAVLEDDAKEKNTKAILREVKKWVGDMEAAGYE